MDGGRRSWMKAGMQLSSHLHRRRARGVGTFASPDMNKEINVRSQGGSSRAKMLWEMCEAKERCED